MKRDYQEVIDAMSNGEYTAEEIKSRIRSYLNNPASKIEGSFAMDSIQAVAQEMARAINMRIIDFIDMAMLDTAVYEFLDRKGLDYGLARNLATASSGYVKFTGAQGTIVPKGTTLLSDTCTFTTDFEAIISSSGTTSVRATCTELGIAGNVLAGAITGIRATEGIDGVQVTNEEPFEGGTEEETDDCFRKCQFLYILGKTGFRRWKRSMYSFMEWSGDCQGRNFIFKRNCT